MDFDATSLHISVMWNNESVYPKMENGFAFTPFTNDVHVEVFNIHTSNHDGNESEILKIKCHNPPDLIFQHLPIKEKA